ncbi:MAG TPA: D-glucuronyl C5-epimerase family protein [Ktedonobacterales bacterium]|nr:D-glucuronyl C5-epimerase family protein [Ktedonobacterales bacterium]
MSRSARWQSFWRAFPITRCIASEWQVWRAEQHAPCYPLAAQPDASAGQLPYPLDLLPLLALPFGSLDDHGVPYNAAFGLYPAVYHPSTIAQYALAHWNAYLADGAAAHLQSFLTQARWLVAHERRIADDAGGWPMPFPQRDYAAPVGWLSALTQGNAISVLVRAYRLTGESAFLQAARRAVRTFELDVLEGGVSVTVGTCGVFFEEVAVYPAAHILNGFILALFGLYDYVEVTQDSHVASLIDESLLTLHLLIDEFDAGYWTRYDLLHRRLVPHFYQHLHATLLAALARKSGCIHCSALAERWAGYQRSFGCRLRYLVISRVARYRRALSSRVRNRLFPAPAVDQHLRQRVCVPVTAFPIAGGVRGVLAGVAGVMADEWHLEYLAGRQGAQSAGLTIHSFGSTLASCWHFPNACFYCLAGWRKLLWLFHRGMGYRLILPQDGLYTGAFAALAGKLVGARVVCMDHGSVTLPFSRVYPAESIRALQGQRWHVRLLSRLRFWCYWPTLRLLARLTARCADQFLIAGDEVEAVFRQYLGVHPSRIIRYPYILDARRYARPDAQRQAALRAQQQLPPAAIVVTMINRLAPEKGLDIAVQGMQQALASLPGVLRGRVRFIIAGDGPSRPQLEAELRQAGLPACCALRGEATPAEVMALLRVSDIFLYTGTRGTNYSMAVLEAMAAGCAVIASTEPRSNAALLADGRGIAIPAGDAAATAAALRRTISDPALRQEMGARASAYVAEHHSGPALVACLRRAGYWSPLPSAAPRAEEQRVLAVGSEGRR